MTLYITVIHVFHISLQLVSCHWEKIGLLCDGYNSVEVNMGMYLQSNSFLALHSSQVNQSDSKLSIYNTIKASSFQKQ